MMWILWNLVSVRLEIVLVSVQDRCAIFAKRTIGSEIILDAPDGTPRDVGLVECHFDPFRDIVCVGAK